MASAGVMLAHRPDFMLGRAQVRPGLGEVAGPGGVQRLEPRVMQVLLALADAQGGTVTRDELLERCWDNRVVGDDVVNRAILQIRKLARDIAGESFAIRTIHKVGYRLEATDAPAAPAREEVPASPAWRPSRRALLVTAGAAAGLAVAIPWVRRDSSAASPELANLLALGLAAREGGTASQVDQSIAYLRTATERWPGSADAWGALALSYAVASTYAEPGDRSAPLARADVAAARALDLDGDQVDARAARIVVQPRFGRWLHQERELRSILRQAPGHGLVRASLGALLGDVGRWRESLTWLAPLAGVDQFSPSRRYVYVYALWNAGRLDEAETALNAALTRWPRHGALWQAKVKFLSNTGRPGQALAFVQDLSARPHEYSPRFEVQVATLRALESGGEPARRRAADLWLADYRASGLGAANLVQQLASLGAADMALDIADGLYLGKGPFAALTEKERTGADRYTSLLFNTLTTPLRRLPRFAALEEGTGLRRYWRESGTLPDYRSA